MHLQFYFTVLQEMQFLYAELTEHVSGAFTTEEEILTISCSLQASSLWKKDETSLCSKPHDPQIFFVLMLDRQRILEHDISQGIWHSWLHSTHASAHGTALKQE